VPEVKGIMAVSRRMHVSNGRRGFIMEITRGRSVIVLIIMVFYVYNNIFRRQRCDAPGNASRTVHYSTLIKIYDRFGQVL
jgi:hypothetical protein